MAVQSQDTQSLKRSRLLYIDNLRIILTALVVLHHLAIQYGAPGITYYVEKGPMSDISIISSANRFKDNDIPITHQGINH